jgi:uracil-DNA glycosylase
MGQVEASNAEPYRLRLLQKVHADLSACTACPNMVRPVVHGPPVLSGVFLLGQAPGPHEGKLMRPFAWTAGKTLFRWFEEALGVPEEQFRRAVYMAAVARCFPGKAKGGGDRKPDADEIARCKPFLVREVAATEPDLVLCVGQLAISEVLGEESRGKKLDQLVGQRFRATYHGRRVDVFPLPHPSGASPWHRMEPGKTLLQKALARIGEHHAWHKATREA